MERMTVRCNHQTNEENLFAVDAKLTSDTMEKGVQCMSVMHNTKQSSHNYGSIKIYFVKQLKELGSLVHRHAQIDPQQKIRLSAFPPLTVFATANSI